MTQNKETKNKNHKEKDLHKKKKPSDKDIVWGSGNSDKNKKNKADEKKPNKRNIVLIVLIAAIVLAFILSRAFAGGVAGGIDTKELSTSEFVAAVKADLVKETTYKAASATLSGKYYEDQSKKDADETTDFVSTYTGDDSLEELMAAHPNTKFSIDVTTNSWLTTLLTTFLPILLFVGLIYFFIRQVNGVNGKQMAFGKTKSKRQGDEIPKVKFSDVAGIDEAVEELQEIRDFLDDPSKYTKMGAKIPRGVLLVGPPGTGKTLLARAVAGEAGVPFFSISGSDFVEMFVGVGASRVRDLFKQAKEASPSIIFIDEIDAVGRQRGAGVGGGHDEREQTLNQLLVEMDGFDENESVIMIAATNRVDILDPALLRPGRFDRQVIVDSPDLNGREKILKVHSKGKPLAQDIDLKTIAGMTSGFTGADLANLLNEAALLAARRGKDVVSNEELQESIERVIAGPERKGRVMTKREKTCIAYHESGHALVGHLLEHTDPVKKISIIARGQALGYTLSTPEEDRFLKSKNEMIDDLAMFLGGRVAEEIVIGDVTTGASNDLERATKIAKQMVTRYGMSDVLGHQVYGEANREVFLGRDYGSTPDYSQSTANVIDSEVTRIMTDAHDTAYRILNENRQQLDLMAQVLLERETVEGKAVKALLDNKWNEYLEEEKTKKLTEAAKAQGSIKEDKAAKAENSNEDTSDNEAVAAQKQTDVQVNNYKSDDFSKASSDNDANTKNSFISTPNKEKGVFSAPSTNNNTSQNEDETSADAKK